jgi:transposase InsO family protein
LRGKTRRKFRRTTDSRHHFPVAENKLGRDFNADKPNREWLADITYLSTSEGFLYLAVVLDVFSRKVVGWSMRDSLETTLVLDALGMARASRQPAQGLLFHGDRGAQYASHDFRVALEGFQAILSMSRKGNCWDNSMMERFFATLKCELDFEGPLRSKVLIRALVFEYITVFCNRQRRHSSLGFVSLERFEELSAVSD